MYMQQVTEYDVTNISGTQPQKNMIMGKVGTSDLHREAQYFKVTLIDRKTNFVKHV